MEGRQSLETGTHTHTHTHHHHPLTRVKTEGGANGTNMVAAAEPSPAARALSHCWRCSGESGAHCNRPRLGPGFGTMLVGGRWGRVWERSWWAWPVGLTATACEELPWTCRAGEL